MSSVLVTGANRGIGLALAQGYANRGWTVWAAARSPARPPPDASTAPAT